MKVMELKEVDFLNIFDQSMEDEKLYAYTGAQYKKKTQDLINQFIDLFQIGMYIKDKNGMVLVCNEYMLKRFGFSSREEIIGKNSYDLISPESAEEIRAIDKMIMDEGIHFKIEEVVESAEEDKTMYFDSSKQCVKNLEGTVLGIIGLAEDISRRKKAEIRELAAQQKELEARKQALEAKEKELIEREKRIKAEEDREAATLSSGIVAHDMKNKLTPLCMQAELLQIVITEIKPHIQNLISPWGANILFTTPEKLLEGFKQLNAEIIEIDEYNKDMLIGSPELIEKHIKIQQIGKSIREIVNLYQERGSIIQVNNKYNFEFMGDHFSALKMLGNLMSNAVRQIALKGQGEIFISTDRNEEYHILKVKDTAGGVTQTLVDNLFEAYKTGEVQGTGLGLASVQMWMKKVKGRIEVHLVDGDKIEFRLFFPKIDVV